MNYKTVESGFILRLKPGEKVVDKLREFTIANNLQAGFVNGIGAVRNVTLGYFDMEQREYLRKEFSGHYELASLQGNLALFEEKPIFHLHCVLADRDCRAIAGHLFEAEVAVTLELQLTTLPDKITRSYDNITGLTLLNLYSKPGG